MEKLEKIKEDEYQDLDIDVESFGFAFSLSGSIDKEFVAIQTDSKKILRKIIDLMDDGEKNNEK